MRKKQAFTLIELLIVVAIIAILAAIAVPNFLEAQTRSKVSRVHSDMRSIATALESYATDNNRAPLGEGEASILFGTPAGVDREFKRLWCFSHLTTPIAYMTSIPTDPFNPQNQGTGSREGGKFYAYDTSYAKQNAWMARAFAQGLFWGLESRGPGRDIYTYSNAIRNVIDPNAINSIYDATNGTVSRGVIIRTNFGIKNQ